jgi:PhzF family phenazine biosynthesis protein
MKLYKVTAFPKTEFGGNKAGVVLDCETLTDREMQKIAHNVGYSETAFVLPSKIADFKVRFFTPYHEVDLCGHATIATFNLLRDLDLLKPGYYTQETKAGQLRLEVKENLVYMEQQKPVFFEKVEKKEIEKCFNKDNFTHKSHPIIIGSTGLREIFIPIIDIETLHSLKFFREEIIELSIKYQVVGLHLFALGEDCDAYSRNFAPFVGIEEESATGTSSGVLGAYFSRFLGIDKKYRFRQGYAMKQPSEILVTLKGKGSDIKEVWVGGIARQIIKPE